MSRLHPVFNVVKLTPAPDDPILGHRPCPPPLPEIVNGVEEWIVEKILDSRMINQKLHYLVKWEGFGIEHNSWEPANDVHAPEHVAEFYWKFPRAPQQVWFMEFNTLPFCHILLEVLEFHQKPLRGLRQVRFTEFDTLPFHNIPPVVPGRHSLERGVDVRGLTFHPTPDFDTLCIPLYHR